MKAVCERPMEGIGRLDVGIGSLVYLDFKVLPCNALSGPCAARHTGMSRETAANRTGRGAAQ
ncbi:hypothetical protein MPC4_30111 [Methylocella tundrae]|uniref:Uncharacterized protein n=1 Tax=Methylocella tundrae TaxID=227605 RepID=A0A8B6M804_METTU|nr:hypothetical protein MPC1_8510002 [Methylocella tundrae]VTZ50927.1 hypothetical protein MPC4_30111 [Methylocella tundrae]